MDETELNAKVRSLQSERDYLEGHVQGLKGALVQVLRGELAVGRIQPEPYPARKWPLTVTWLWDATVIQESYVDVATGPQGFEVPAKIAEAIQAKGGSTTGLELQVNANTLNAKPEKSQ